MNTPVYAQVSFAGRCDNGSESGATWKFANGTCGDTVGNATNRNWSQLVDENFRVRFALDETSGNGDSENNQIIQFQYNRNSTGWNNIGTATSVVKAVASGDAGFTNDGDTTQQLLAGTFITDNNGQCEDGVTGTANWPGSGAGMDVEVCLQIIGTDVSDGDTIEIRCTKSPGQDISTYSNTPSITVDFGQVDNEVQMMSIV